MLQCNSKVIMMKTSFVVCLAFLVSSLDKVGKAKLNF